MKFGWEIEGVISEKRELRAKATGDVFARQFKIVTLGATVDVRVTQHMFGDYNENEQIHATGRFEFYNNQAIFHVVDIKKVTGKAA